MFILSSYPSRLFLALCTFLVLKCGSLMASNTDFTPVFIGTFNGTEVDGNNFNFPSSAESDAGFSNLAQIYPLRFKSSGSITFTASAPNGDVGIYFRFESNPWPKVNPAFNTSPITISGATPIEYTINIPSQGISANNIIQVDSTPGGAFDNLVDSTTLPADITSIGTSTDIQDGTYFKTIYISGIGNRDSYKAGLNDTKTTDVAGWAGSFNTQEFTINVTSLSPNTPGGTNVGPRWRYLKTYANGTTNLGAIIDLELGLNTLTIPAVSSPAATWTGRTVGVLIEGVVKYDSFSHNYGDGIDSINVVPDPSTYVSNTFNSAALYLTTRDTEVTLTDFRINANAHSTTSKKKMLVLHGYNSTGLGTGNWTPFQQLEKALGNDYEFYYATAPVLTSSSGGDWYGNLDDSLSTLSRIIDTTGPYYGVIGYSQGTSMIMSLINYKKNLPFERVVLFNGFAPGAGGSTSTEKEAILAELNAQKPFNNSVFVFVGYNDPVVDYTESYYLSSFFKNSQTVTDYSRSTGDGHRPPYQSETGFQEVVDFITSNDIDSDGVPDALDAYPHDTEQHALEPLTIKNDSSSVRIDWDAKVNQNWKIYKKSRLSSETNTEIPNTNCVLDSDRLSYTESIEQESSFYFLKSD